MRETPFRNSAQDGGRADKGEGDGPTPKETVGKSLLFTHSEKAGG